MRFFVFDQQNYLSIEKLELIIILFCQKHMQNQSRTELLPLELQNSDSVSLVNQKSFENTLSEDENRVVKNQLLQKSNRFHKPNEPPQRQNVHKAHKKSKWSDEDQLQYFYASIIFACTNPYYTLSWEWWKPACFYKYMDRHMATIFNKKGKDAKQCKTKDQNLKIKFYEKPQQPTDLIELSLFRLAGYVDQAKIDHKSGNKMSIQVIQRVDRYEEALFQYKRFMQRMKQPKVYEIQQQLLNENTAEIRSTLQQLASALL